MLGAKLPLATCSSAAPQRSMWHVEGSEIKLLECSDNLLYNMSYKKKPSYEGLKKQLVRM